MINTATKTVVATIATAGSPAHDIALTPDGSKLYVALEFGGIGRILTATNSFTVISTAACAEGLRVTPDGSRLYVSYQCGGPGGSGGHDAVGIFNVATDAFFSSVTGLPNVGQGASTGISPNGAQFWENGEDACSSPAYDHVGCPTSPGVPEIVVNVIQTSSNTLLKSLGFTTSEGAGSVISFFPNGSQALLGGNSLKVIDTASFATTASIPIPASGSVVFTPDGTRAYAPVPSQNTVAVLSGFIQSSGPTIMPSINAVTNGASNLTGPVAPGEIVVLYGSTLGPGQLTLSRLTNPGFFDTQTAGTQVRVNGILAPIIYTWATQVAAIIPYGVSGTAVQVSVTYQNQTSATMSVPLAPSSPALFTLDSTGKGPAAVLNQDQTS